MADKRIQDLTPASSVQTSDRFVLEQSGQAKSLTGQILLNDLAVYLDGHGGIANIVYTAPSGGSLDGTLTITLADETEETFTVENGRGIVSISKTATVDLVDEYTIYYNDNTSSVFYVTNGEKGDTGDNWFVHIKWSATEPTQDSDMSDTPDNWIGIYSGLGATAPTSYTEYTWFEYKGETGDTGNGIESISFYSSSGVVDTYRVLFTNGSSTTFEVTNGSNISSITKTSSAGLTDTYTVTLTNGDTTNFTVSNAKSITSITPPGNPGLPGQTDRYIINFNNGDTTFFDVYNGTNGTGSVSLVDNIAPLGGDVPLLTFGSGAPTVDTPGSVKSRYFDTLNNQLYICVAVDEESTPNTYTWRGSSVTVDSVLSTTSTNPVQNAVLTAIIGTTPLDTTAQTLTEAVNEILVDISGFADNLADEYDPTATYAVGDLCIHDNTLYRCNTAITTAEAWNSLHWTQTTVADDKVSKTGDTMTGNLSVTSSGSSAEVDVVNSTNKVKVYTNAEGGNVRLEKGNAHCELDTAGMNTSGTGFARLYLNDGTNTEVTKTFLFKQDGDFVNGNGVTLDTLDTTTIKTNVASQTINAGASNAVLGLIGSTNSEVRLIADGEGGNIRLSKGNALAELDTYPMATDGTGSTRLYVNNGQSGGTIKIFLFRQDGGFVDGNNVSTTTLNSNVSTLQSDMSTAQSNITTLLNNIVHTRTISGTATGDTTYADCIKKILTSNAPQSQNVGIYTGSFISSSSGMGSWTGLYVLNVSAKNTNYATQGFVIAQGRFFIVWYQAAVWVVTQIGS